MYSSTLRWTKSCSSERLIYKLKRNVEYFTQNTEYCFRRFGRYYFHYSVSLSFLNTQKRRFKMLSVTSVYFILYYMNILNIITVFTSFYLDTNVKVVPF